MGWTVIEMWALFAIFATVLWCCGNIIDKHVFGDNLRKPVIGLIVFSFIGLIFSTVIFGYNFESMSLLHIALCFMVGFFFIFGFYFYIKSLTIEEVSRVIPLFYVGPVLTLILATIFLGETFVPLQYVGITLLISGAILVSVRFGQNITFSKVFWFMMGAAFSVSMGMIIIRYLLTNGEDFLTVFAYTRLGLFLFMIPIILLYASQFRETVKKHGKKAIGFMSASATFNLGASIAIFTALSFAGGYASLVSALTAVQPLFILIFATIISFYYPKILQEELKGSVIAIKVAAIVLIIIGAFLII